MADVLVVNEVPATNTPFFSLFRLYETLVSAGWAHVESSRGTGDTPSTSDRWSGSFASLVSGAWVVLQGVGGNQIVFYRSTTSTTLGWIVWCTGYVTGAGSATVPGALPTGASFIRGSGTAPSTWTTGGAWFGGTGNVATLNIGARSATGIGAPGSFWVIAQVVGQAFTTATAAGVHRLGFEKVLRFGAGSPGYAWWCPISNTSTWNSHMNSQVGVLINSATSCIWRAKWNVGQVGEEVVPYSSGSAAQITSATAGSNPNFASAGQDLLIYQATSRPLVRRIMLARGSASDGLLDADGGYTTDILFSSPDIASLSTINSGAYAKLGAVVVWWNGNAAIPPVEN